MRGKNMKSKEIRYLAFIIASIVLAILICITNINNGSVFGVIVSIFLLALLCTGLGYLYCKYEDKILGVFKEQEVAEQDDAVDNATAWVNKIGEEAEF
jgi:hypothetical protein